MPKTDRREDASLKNGVLGDRITVRLTKELRDFVLLASAGYGITPAELVRQVLYTARSGYMRAYEASNELVKQAVKEAEAEILKRGTVEDGTDRTTNEHDLV